MGTANHRVLSIKFPRISRQAANTAGTALLTVGGGLAAAHVFRSMWRFRKFKKLLDADTDRKLLDEFVAEGMVPSGVDVLQDKRSILAAMDRESDADAGTPISRFFARRRNRRLAETVMRGGNAYMIPGIVGNPAIAVPPGKISRSVLAHEIGHIVAANRRKTHKEYSDEYESAMNRSSNPLNIANPTREKNKDGTFTVVGLEREAWDNANACKGAINGALRDSALDTYRLASVGSAYLAPVVAAITAGGLLKAYGIKAFG